MKQAIEDCIDRLKSKLVEHGKDISYAAVLDVERFIGEVRCVVQETEGVESKQKSLEADVLRFKQKIVAMGGADELYNALPSLLTVEAAREKKVCRICCGPATPRRIGNYQDPFVLNFGDEHAHRSCINATSKNPNVSS